LSTQYQPQAQKYFFCNGRTVLGQFWKTQRNGEKGNGGDDLPMFQVGLHPMIFRGDGGADFGDGHGMAGDANFHGLLFIVSTKEKIFIVDEARQE
jgi:hypothetical protein